MARANTTRDGEAPLTTRLRQMAYIPWRGLVFVPFILSSTLFFGSAAVVSSILSPKLAHHCGTLWAWLLCKANFTSVRLIGKGHADPAQSYIIMSNHQSHFDVLAFYGHWWRQFRWVMKEELRKVPGLGAGCEAVGHIFVDRSDRAKAVESLKRAQERLEPGTSIMIFPEGVRSLDGRLGPFKKGGFMMALDMELPILPVSISGSRKILPGKTMRLMPGTIHITVHEPIDPMEYGMDRRDELMADVRAAIASGLTPEELEG